MSASQAFSQKLYEAAARDANAAGTKTGGVTRQMRQAGAPLMPCRDRSR
ncbi:MAG: hypothetical protein ACO3CS_05620 [Alphaproteobacteria bacterium]